MEQQKLTAIKVGYNGEIHRLRVDLTTFTFADLQALFATTFSLAPASFVIQYKDNETDCVTVNSSSDFEEACRFFMTSADEAKSLRFIAVPSTPLVFNDNVAEPILKVIEHLVQTLNEAMEKVKQEQWAAKAQENARDFAAKAQVSAGEWASQAQVNAGVWSNKASDAMNTSGEKLSEAFAQTSVIVNEKLAEAGAVLGPLASKTLEESKAAFEAAKKGLNEIEFDKIKQSLNEIEFDRLMKDATEGMKAAAVVATNYANNLVSELNKLKDHTVEVTVVPVDAPVAVAVEAPAEDDVVEVAVPVHEATAEAEWEQVQEEVAAPTPSAEELKWAAQLALVREVFPTSSTDSVVALLEAAHGDVHVVLNQLFEL
ncbi:hypothetical protein H310_09044 [Aphanomyces invadans]|uniref:PB1 domain-containing protein n=1 Tax=Aphanomyces invadans TaxID=157072 RepID=A0A024TXK2_9STRA|nr:hypothetical protein H310_09044 [Aphanomyces invadans]ETV98351.1 hypothetical protein H310_09044 [Aphanomyces invadans]RHY28072.1 hypothetical protein DYB32_006280 [Aphanomyces invadans]|eukprot:XP_008873226.1 hypothetical protein H310_09044 [Aphanomyces invadans]